MNINSQQFRITQIHCLGIKPCVDDHMILNILNIDAAIDNLPLSDSHSVMVHLVKCEVSICMKSLKHSIWN